MEPSGDYDSVVNGQVKQSIGVLCIQAQICLFALSLDVSFWCFALSQTSLLCNFCPRTDTLISSHEVLLKKGPKYSNLAIWGWPVYVVNWQCTSQQQL
jgi:hypothetical protein